MSTRYTTHPDEMEVHYNMGSDVEIIGYNHHGKTFLCGGCETPITISVRGVKNGQLLHPSKTVPLKGYPHTGGFHDSNGKKWWLFVHCPKCEYDTAMLKIPLLEKKFEHKSKLELEEREFDGILGDVQNHIENCSCPYCSESNIP